MNIFGVEIEGDHTFTRESVERYIEQAYRAGQEDERAKIVAWLRWMDDPADYADEIERGEHLNMPPPTN